jgi:hypothetical protein
MIVILKKKFNFSLIFNQLSCHKMQKSWVKQMKLKLLIFANFNGQFNLSL